MHCLASRLATQAFCARTRPFFGSSRSSSYDVLHGIAMSRASEFDFDSSKTIAPEVMRSIIATTQTAPSSFNFQPYKIILVSSRDLKEVLARTACFGYQNTSKVANCSVLAVFLGDKIPSDLTNKVVALEAAGGADPGYVTSLPQKTAFLGSPTSAGAEAWSEKNTAFAAQNYMLAATALGLSTCCMEGFDARRVISLLEIPERRYSVPFIIATGFPMQGARTARKKVRFPLEEVVYADSFGRRY